MSNVKTLEGVKCTLCDRSANYEKSGYADGGPICHTCMCHILKVRKGRERPKSQIFEKWAPDYNKPKDKAPVKQAEQVTPGPAQEEKKYTIPAGDGKDVPVRFVPERNGQQIVFRRGRSTTIIALDAGMTADEFMAEFKNVPADAELVIGHV